MFVIKSEGVFENTGACNIKNDLENSFLLTDSSNFNMGINICSSILWTADNVSLSDLAAVHRSRNDTFSTCRVDIDVNNVACA